MLSSCRQVWHDIFTGFAWNVLWSSLANFRSTQNPKIRHLKELNPRSCIPNSKNETNGHLAVPPSSAQIFASTERGDELLVERLNRVVGVLWGCGLLTLNPKPCV